MSIEFGKKRTCETLAKRRVVVLGSVALREAITVTAPPIAMDLVP